MSLTSIGNILKKIASEKNWEERFKVFQAWACWDEVVGGIVAREAQPRSFKQGCLWVGVSDPMWMHHLQMSKEVIRNQLNAKLGSTVIRDIRFTLASPNPHKDVALQRNTVQADHK